ncbi:MAG: hypothetical protein H6667_22925 [Ardenticatenaceae bacterium]|nr:hypothetical protein [Ardenticatenaceae bacterium]
MSGKFWQWEIKDGQSVTVGDRTVTPQAQVLSLRLPGNRSAVAGGFVWNRPVAVLVEENGRSQRIPIPDMTRMIVLAAAVVGTAVTLLIKSQSDKAAK